MSTNDQILYEMAEELWKIRNPHLPVDKQEVLKLKAKLLDLSANEPVSQLITKPLPHKKAFFDLVTARNKNLINPDEQNQLRQTVVGFFGMSVGSHAALTWMLESRADQVKIIDHDTISASNLNRLRIGWNDIGLYKTDIVKRDLYAINPYTNVYSTLITTPDSIRNLFSDDPELNVVVDEIDDLESKILLRKLAKDKKIPLLSATDVGDNIIVDIERYDLDSDLQPFLGRIKDVDTLDFSSLTNKDKRKLVISYVGFESNSERMIESLMSIGGSIVTWPQLGATATISGGIITTLIKKIILGERVLSGRYYVSLDDIFVSDFNEPIRKEKRDRKIAQVEYLIKSR